MIEAGMYTERRPVLENLTAQRFDGEKALSESTYRIVTDTIHVITEVSA